MKLLTILLALFCSLFAQAQSQQIPLNDYVEKNLSPEARSAFFQELEKKNIHPADLNGIVLAADHEDGHLVILGDEHEHTKEMLVYVGIQVGTFFPKAFEGVGMIRKDGRPWIDTNIRIEPSALMQSYSAGAAIHIKGTGFLVGTQVRDFRLAPSSDPYYDPETDRFLALSAEIGYRNAFGKSKRFMASFTVGATYVPSNRISLPVMYNVNVGIGYRLGKK